MLPSSDHQPPIGILGFGAFGRLMAVHLRAWFPLHVYDPAVACEGLAGQYGIRFVDIASAGSCPIVIFAVPVARLADAITSVRPHLRSGALALDVGSVKVEPAKILQANLPEDVEIVGTHPLFGPQSARNGIAGLKIAVCPIRGRSAHRVAAFLQSALKLRVYLTTPDDHDRESAMVQGLTHLIAKLLVQMEPLPTRMTTPSFDQLMRAVEMVRYDSQAVTLAIEQANPHAPGVCERFFSLTEEMRSALSSPGDHQLNVD